MKTLITVIIILLTTTCYSQNVTELTSSMRSPTRIGISINAPAVDDYRIGALVEYDYRDGYLLGMLDLRINILRTGTHNDFKVYVGGIYGMSDYDLGGGIYLNEQVYLGKGVWGITMTQRLLIDHSGVYPQARVGVALRFKNK